MESIIAESVAESARTARIGLMQRIGALHERYVSVRDSILGNNPTEKVPEFGPLATEVRELDELQKVEADRSVLVRQLEDRREVLEREWVAKMSDVERLTLRIRDIETAASMLNNRLLRLERGEGAAGLPQAPAMRSRAERPQMLVPGQGPSGAGLGGVSAAFGAPPAPSGGGVRRVGG